MSKSKFLNLNLNGGNPQYTQEDVTSQKPEESQERVDTFESMETNGLTDLAKAVDTPETPSKAFNFKLIPREKLVFNKNNDFPMDEVEELSEKILANGLLHNLAALYDSDLDKYILESGERRLRACDLAHDRYKDVESKETDSKYLLYVEHIKDFYIYGFPVNVKRPKYQEDEELIKVDEIDSDLRKYTANIDVRTFSAQQRAAYTQRVRELLEEKSSLLHGNSAPKVTQAQVAEATGISERQVRKYDAVNELIPALKAEFENGRLSINKVPTIAKMSEEEQLVFLEFLQRERNVDPVQVKLYMERAERAEQEKSSLQKEKETLEAELEELRSSQNEKVDRILAESKEREELIQKEIKKAEREKNESRIIKLQQELADEKDSAGRMIKDTSNRLETSQRALADANQRIRELEEQENDTEQIEAALRTRAELDLNITFLSELCIKTMASLQSYMALAEPDAVTQAINEICGIKGLKELVELAEQ